MMTFRVPFLSAVAFPRRSEAPWSPQFPVWIIEFGPAKAGILRSHMINSNHVCGLQTDQRDNLDMRGRTESYRLGLRQDFSTS